MVKRDGEKGKKHTDGLNTFSVSVLLLSLKLCVELGCDLHEAQSVQRARSTCDGAQKSVVHYVTERCSRASQMDHSTLISLSTDIHNTTH